MRVQPQKHRRYAQTVLCFSVKRHETIKPLDAVAAGRTLFQHTEDLQRPTQKPTRFFPCPKETLSARECHTVQSHRWNCVSQEDGEYHEHLHQIDLHTAWQRSALCSSLAVRPALNTHLSTTTFLWRRTEANGQSIVRRLKQRKAKTP